jgi:hypothetical protein
MSKSSKFVGLAATAALVAGAWGLWSNSNSEEIAKADKLANQVWIDRVPENERDMITHLLLLDHPRAKNFGIIGHSSQWRHHIEVTRWRLDGNNLGLFFPQERHKAKLKARTWSCEGEAPAPFDLCLELKRGDKTLRLYSHHDWVVEPQGDPEDQFEELIEGVDALRNLHEVEVAELDEFDADAFELSEHLSGPLAVLDGPVDDED